MTNAERNALHAHNTAAATALEAAYCARHARLYREQGLDVLADRNGHRANAYVAEASFHADWADATERRAGVSVFPGTRRHETQNNP